MATKLPPHLVDSIKAAQHYAPPSPRELRAQAVHRLQLGVFGLCAMLLIVGLASIIMDRARLADEADPIREVVAADAPAKKAATDPLADIGLVPAAEPSPAPLAVPLPTVPVPGEGQGANAPVAGQRPAAAPVAPQGGNPPARKAPAEPRPSN